MFEKLLSKAQQWLQKRKANKTQYHVVVMTTEYISADHAEFQDKIGRVALIIEPIYYQVVTQHILNKDYTWCVPCIDGDIYMSVDKRIIECTITPVKAAQDIKHVGKYYHDAGYDVYGISA